MPWLLCQVLPLLLCGLTHGAVPVPLPQCSAGTKGVCMTAAKPILRIIKHTDDSAACCAACTNLTACAAWNINTAMKQCFLRATGVPTNPGSQCISQQLRPNPPSPPPPAPLPPSDQRPRFHFAPTTDFTNDVQGPFYDATHQRYHMGFAWHVNGTKGIGSAPNRWYHIVSDDLAHWKIISTTAERAMISPGDQNTSFDDTGVMTGSVTIVDGVPTALYSCHGHECPGKGGKPGPCPVIAAAHAANLEDPNLVLWKKTGVVMINQAPGFRDPSTAWESGGMWRVLTACERCNGSESMLGLFSSKDFVNWVFTSTPLDVSQLECPDYWTLNLNLHLDKGNSVDGSVSSGSTNTNTSKSKSTRTLLSAIKLSCGGKEVVHVGTWNETTQTLKALVAPRLPAQRHTCRGKVSAGTVNGSLLDAATYASKSFHDPVHQQQVWTSWIHESFEETGGGCLNASVCSTHTLPRALRYDPELAAFATPVVPQTSLLRGEKLFALEKPTTLPLADGVALDIPAAATSGMQLEILATFALPLDPTLSVGMYVRDSGGSAPKERTTISLAIAAGIAVPAEEAAANANSLFLPALKTGTLQTHADNTNDLIPGKKANTYTHDIHFAVKASETNVTLRVFVDHSVVEAYAAGGRGVITTRTYPTDAALGVSIFANATTSSRTPDDESGVATATLLALEVWPMHEIWV